MNINRYCPPRVREGGERSEGVGPEQGRDEVPRGSSKASEARLREEKHAPSSPGSGRHELRCWVLNPDLSSNVVK